MTKNAQSRRVVNELIRQLDSGTNITILARNVDISPYLSPQLRSVFSRPEARALSKRILRYLRQQKLISLHEQPRGRYKLRLTKTGQLRAHKISLLELSIPRPQKWDRKWRVIFFDIPETQRQDRNRFVLKLKDLGFYQLQRSIWVHPYPCHIEIAYLTKAYGLGSFVSLAEISKIDKHNQLLHVFSRLVPQRRMS